MATELTVGEVINSPLFVAEAVATQFSHWLNVRLLTIPGLNYPCERCRVLHYCDSKIGQRHQEGGERWQEHEIANRAALDSTRHVRASRLGVLAGS